MQVQLHIPQVKSSTLTIDLPESFMNHQVEIIIKTLDDDPLPKRKPHPDIAGKLQVYGDIIDSVPEGDWNLPR